MTTTDIDGSPLLILSKREAEALRDYFRHVPVYNLPMALLTTIVKANEVADE